ncbi:sensor histidine kinase [Eubacteriaceae bacterium ES2]|nr:sensor histidine kinase [Eubacteriaceae bacterium ES2]
MSVKAVFKAYLQERLPVIICLALVVGIFSGVEFLNNIDVSVTLLGLRLTVFGLLVIACLDFYRYNHRCRELHAFREAILIERKPLVEAKNLPEGLYRRAIDQLFENRMELQVQLENSKKELNDYYTLWAHQIKTPISVMDLMLQSSDAIDLKQMRQELFKTREYVEMVLQYLRLESIAADMILKEYVLIDLVQEAIRKYSLFFIQKKIRLEMAELETGVITDKKWFVFCLEQLLSNALKYTRTGVIKIYLDQEQLVIEDSGIGIHAEDLDRIFDRGFTGYAGRIDRKSTGIGLYLTKKVINKLGYKIYAESQPGQGTKMKIDLTQQQLDVI